MGDTRLYPDAKHGLKGKYVAGVLTFTQADAPGQQQATGLGVRYVFTSTNVRQAATVDNGDMRGLSVIFNANGDNQYFSTGIRGACVIGAGHNPRNPRGVTGVLDMSAAGARVQGSGFAVLAQLITEPQMQTSGTIAVIQAQLTCSVGFQVMANQMAFMRFSLGGDAGAMGLFDNAGYLFMISGATPGAAPRLVNNTNLTIGAGDPAGASFIGLRIKVGAADYYIPAIVAGDWN